MGKGDKKTKKGKIALGSFGNVRPRKKSKSATAAKAAPKSAAPKAAKPARPAGEKAAPKKAAKKGE